MQCKSCGAELDYREAFCSQCGELTGRGRSTGGLLGGIGGQLANSLSGVTDPANRKTVMAVGIGLVALLTAFTDNPISSRIANLFSRTPNTPQLTAEGLPDLATYEDVFLSEESEFIVLANTNVRDYPTSQGTNVIGSLEEGSIIKAREVQAFDPSSRWLKLASGGYVWGQNLESMEQIAHEAGSTGQTDVAFPAFVQGRWSWSEGCQTGARGDDVNISANTMQFEHSAGTLVKITEEGRSRIYHLEMSNVAQNWTAKFAITIAEDGAILFLDGVGESSGTNYVLYDPGANCGNG